MHFSLLESIPFWEGKKSNKEFLVDKYLKKWDGGSNKSSTDTNVEAILAWRTRKHSWPMFYVWLAISCIIVFNKILLSIMATKIKKFQAKQMLSNTTKNWLMEVSVGVWNQSNYLFVFRNCLNAVSIYQRVKKHS